MMEVGNKYLIRTSTYAEDEYVFVGNVRLMGTVYSRFGGSKSLAANGEVSLHIAKAPPDEGFVEVPVVGNQAALNGYRLYRPGDLSAVPPSIRAEADPKYALFAPCVSYRRPYYRTMRWLKGRVRTEQERDQERRELYQEARQLDIRVQAELVRLQAEFPELRLVRSGDRNIVPAEVPVALLGRWCRAVGIESVSRYDRDPLAYTVPVNETLDEGCE